MAQNPNDPKVQAYYRKQREAAEAGALRGDAKSKATLSKIAGKLEKGTKAQRTLARAKERPILEGPSANVARATRVEDDPVAQAPFAAVDAAGLLGRALFPRIGEGGAKMLVRDMSRDFKVKPQRFPRVVGKANVSDARNPEIERAFTGEPKALPKPKGKLGKDYKQPKVGKAGTPRMTQESPRARGVNIRQHPKYKRLPKKRKAAP